MLAPTPTQELARARQRSLRRTQVEGLDMNPRASRTWVRDAILVGDNRPSEVGDVVGEIGVGRRRVGA